MASTKSGEIKLQVRGKLNEKSPIYAIYRDSETSLFRTLKGLAEEAVAVRSMLLLVNGLEHPLKNRLSNLTSSEAVTFLLGITQNAGLSTLSEIIGKDIVSVTNKSLQNHSIGEASRTDTSLTEPSRAAYSVDENWDQDMADALDTFSEIPKLQ
jgi:hypothetical protein